MFSKNIVSNPWIQIQGWFLHQYHQQIFLRPIQVCRSDPALEVMKSRKPSSDIWLNGFTRWKVGKLEWDPLETLREVLEKPTVLSPLNWTRAYSHTVNMDVKWYDPSTISTWRSFRDCPSLRSYALKPNLCLRSWLFQTSSVRDCGPGCKSTHLLALSENEALHNWNGWVYTGYINLFADTSSSPILLVTYGCLPWYFYVCW